jgi:hypothetical protein
MYHHRLVRRYLADMSAPVETCWMLDTDLRGNDISTAAGQTEESCQQLCAATVACKFWTMNSNCLLKTSNAGFEIYSGETSGPKSCGSRREAGYEVLVTDGGDASVQFAVTPCEYPIATSSTCQSCGNDWTSFTSTNHGACSWFSCSSATIHYCSSPSLNTLPHDYVDPIISTSHYGNPANGCMADEVVTNVTGFSGSICSPSCYIDGTCSADVPEGVTATPNCTLTEYGATLPSLCALECTTSAECGSLGRCLARTGFASLCMYDSA